VLVRSILSLVSQSQRKVISERTKDALAHKKANRERTEGAPYGWQLPRDGVHLDVSAEEQAIIQAAQELKETELSLLCYEPHIDMLRIGQLSPIDPLTIDRPHRDAFGSVAWGD
jgi:DNA invertase Pin-like site-specific DNA recombinase